MYKPYDELIVDDDRYELVIKVNGVKYHRGMTPLPQGEITVRDKAEDATANYDKLNSLITPHVTYDKEWKGPASDIVEEALDYALGFSGAEEMFEFSTGYVEMLYPGSCGRGLCINLTVDGGFEDNLNSFQYYLLDWFAGAYGIEIDEDAVDWETVEEALAALGKQHDYLEAIAEEAISIVQDAMEEIADEEDNEWLEWQPFAEAKILEKLKEWE